MIDSLYRRDPGLGAPFGAAPAGPVRITPNRRQIDRRFPVLGFTVDAGGLPFFEVLLTTDRALFDPANAARRSASNFYASRQDSGLIAAELQGSVYMAPAAVLHAFAGAREVFYAAIAYQGRDGSGPAFSQQPSELPSAAPSVEISPDFRQAAAGITAAVLSVPLARLCRLRDDGTLSPLGLPLADPAADDRAEGEDGYGLAAEEGAWSAGDEDGWGDPEPTAHAADHEGGWDPQALAGGEDWDYDDGYGSAAEAGEEDGWGAAQESTFPAGAEAPPMLEDEDGPSYGEESSYDDGFGPEAGSAAAEGYMPADDGRESDEDDRYDEAAGLDFDEEPPPYERLEAAEAFQQAPPAVAAQPLTIPEKRRLLAQVAPFESGADGYAAINADGEFEGRFPNHPAQGRWHVGLSYGIVQFTQDSGSLGRLLEMMRQRDAQAFARIFGPQADELVRVATAPGPGSADSPGGRSSRVQPVAGADLWREPWLSRFRQAAPHVPFQAAQNELASALYLDPMLPFAGWLDLSTDRALAMVLDRSVQMGPGGARLWIIEGVGPVQTAAQRQQALAALGHADLTAFQQATRGLTADGSWGPLTHAALVAALRRLGSRSPVPVATRDQMLDALVRRAAGTRWERRTAGLRRSTAFTDVVYAL